MKEKSSVIIESRVNSEQKKLPFLLLTEIITKYIFSANYDKLDEPLPLTVTISSSQLEEAFHSSLDVLPNMVAYLGTSITEKKDNIVHYMTLCNEIVKDNSGITLSFDRHALKLFLFRDIHCIIQNSIINKMMLQHSKPCGIIYEWCSSYCYAQKFSLQPEKLLQAFEVHYDITTLIKRIIEPSKAIFDRLYKDGRSNITFTYMPIRSRVGRGAPVNNINFYIIDRDIENRKQYMRNDYLSYAKKYIKEIFPEEYSIIEYQINYMSASQCYDLYVCIKNIKDHPDYGNIEDARLVRFLLNTDFGIKIDRIPEINELFRRPPSPEEYRRQQWLLRKEEIKKEKELKSQSK